MFERVRTLWQQNRAGLAGSALLHLLFVVIVLWWGLTYPVVRQSAVKPILLDLVARPVEVPVLGPSGGSHAILHAPVPAAPKTAGVKSKATTPAPDEMEARIATMAQLRAPDTALPAADNGAGSGEGNGGGYTLADFVRAQILRRWWPQLDSDAKRGTPVAIRLKLSRTGEISDVVIVDQTRYINDKLFRNMAISARNAALLASPISLPPGHYDAVMDIAITLDPRAVLK